MAEIKPRISTEGRTRLETVIPLTTPYLVFLDPSDICNAKCSWCPTGSGEANKYKRPQFMTYGTFKKAIEDMGEFPEKIKTLRLYKDGEPLLNPRFIDMVGYAKDSGYFLSIDTTTNGILLKDKRFLNLIDAGLDKIFISVPGNYSKSYLNGVKRFYSHAQGTCAVFCKIIDSGLPGASPRAFLEDFGSACDHIFVEHRVNCWPNFDSGEDLMIGIYSNPLTDVKVCPYIFYSLSINSNGTVSLCFLDWNRSLLLRNINQTSLREIWGGELLRYFRIMMLRGKRSSMRMCSNCKQLIYGMPDDIDQYADELLRSVYEVDNATA